MVVTQTGGVVGVFWDHETCPPPANVPVYKVVQWIHLIALEYGAIIRFNTYLDVRADANLSLISVLQDAGVSLAHCGGSDRAEAVCTSMTLDLFTFALDYNIPSFVVITQNPNLSPCLAALKRRQHHILLSTPPGSSPVLCAQGSRVLILGWQSFSEPAFADTSAHPPTSHGAGSARTADPLAILEESPLNPSHLNVIQSNAHSVEELYEADETHSHTLDVRHAQKIIRGLPTDDDSDEDQKPAMLTCLLERDFPRLPVTGSSVPASPTTLYASHIHVGHVDDDDASEDSTEKSDEASSSELSTASGQRLDNSSLLIRGPVTACATKTQRSLSDVPNAPILSSMLRPQFPQVTNPQVPASPSCQYSRPSVDLKFQVLVAALGELARDGEPMPQWSTLGELLLKRDKATYAKAGCEKLKSYLEQAEAAGIVTTGGRGAKLWITLLPLYSKPTSSAKAPASATLAPVTATSQNQYKALIDALRQLAHQGLLSPEPCELGTPLLQRDPDIYKKAGVNKLGDYLALAQAAGVVTLGGTKSRPRVQLTSKYAAS